MPDPELVQAIKAYKNQETNEFFYGKACPAFISLFNRFYTDCEEVAEFISEIYIDIMSKQKKTKHRKIDTYRFEKTFKNWVAFIALRFCQLKYRHRQEIQSFDTLDRGKESPELSILVDSSLTDKEDVEKIINQMANKRYQEIIRLHYIEGLSLEQTASHLNMGMKNFYNKHRLAKVQYLAIYNKEFSK